MHSRIVALADVYDALRSARPYKAPCDENTTLSVMREENGRRFAPQVFAAFEKALEEFRAIRSDFPDREDGEKRSNEGQKKSSVC